MGRVPLSHQQSGGIDRTSLLAKLTPPVLNVAGREFNVKTYGADPTGATDSSNAFLATIAAAAAQGGGEVAVTIPGTYLLNGPNGQPSSYAGLSWAVPITADNICIRSVPGVIFKTTVNAITFFAVGYGKPAGAINWANYWISDITYTPVKNITGTYARGANAITLQNAGDGASFAVGDWVYVRTGQIVYQQQPDGEINKIAGVSGGVLTLAWPLSKPLALEYYANVGHTGMTTTTNAGFGSAPFGVAKINDRLLQNFSIIGGRFLITGDGAAANPGGGAVLPPTAIQPMGIYGLRIALDPGSRISGHLMSADNCRDYQVDASMHFTPYTYSQHSAFNGDVGCTDGIGNIIATAEAGIPSIEMHEGCSGMKLNAILRMVAGDPANIPVLSAGGRNYGCDYTLDVYNGPQNAFAVLADLPDVIHGNTIRPRLYGSFPGGGININALGYRIVDDDANDGSIIVKGWARTAIDTIPIIPTLGAGWTVPVGYRTPRYAMMADGSVHVEGVITNSSGGVLGTSFFTLPTGYRPSEIVIAFNNYNTTTWLIVYPNGAFAPNATVANNAVISFTFDFWPV